MEIPFLAKMKKAQKILLAGAGGGYDIANGVFLYLYLRAQGCEVYLANLSFATVGYSDCEEWTPGCYEVLRTSNISEDARHSDYFPEKHILEWLYEVHGESPKMYAFSNQIGVLPLTNAYQKIIDEHDIDTVVLVDGGTDSLMFGDESGVATIVEDACSMLAATETNIPNIYLMSIGFGVENFHKLNHYACLENISTLTKLDAFLGCLSLTKNMKEGQEFLALTDYLNNHLNHQSIVVNSIAHAMRGEYGDFHHSKRTKNSEQYINPLMPICWFFEARAIAQKIVFRERALDTYTMQGVVQAYRLYYATHTLRPDMKIPLV